MNAKNDSSINISAVVLFITLICINALLLSLAFRQNQIISLATRTIIIANIIGGLLAVKNNSEKNKAFIFYLGALALICILSIIISKLDIKGANGGLYNDAVKMTGFLALPFYIAFYNSFKITEKIKSLVYFNNIISSVILVFLSLSPLRNIYINEWGVRSIRALTLGFDNPNQTSMYLFVCIIILFSSIAYYKNRLLKFILLCLFLYLSYLITATLSRTGILLLFIFLALLIFKKLVCGSSAVIAAALTIPFIYFIVSYTMGPFFSKWKIMGEDIWNGRKIIYDRLVYSWTPITFFLGDFSEFGFQNMHNGYVAVISTTGVISFIIFLLFLYKMLSSIKKQKELRLYEYAAYAGLICIILHTSSEAAFIASGVIYAALFGVVYLLGEKDSSSKADPPA